MVLADRGTLSREGLDVRFHKNWQVIFYNDDTTTIEFVIGVLVKVFEYSAMDALKLTKHIEYAGSSVVAVLPKKLAEVRVKKTRSLADSAGYIDFRVEMKEED